MAEVGKARMFVGLLILAVIVGLLGLIRSGKLKTYNVASGSMEPTLQIGDLVFVSSRPFYDKDDIVAFPHPNEPHADPLVKRVVGVAGDVIKVQSGVLYINGEAQISGNVTTNRINVEDTLTKVPDGHIFMLGDNRNESEDSLNFGAVDEETVIGKLSFIYWPLKHWGKVKNHDEEAAKPEEAPEGEAAAE